MLVACPKCGAYQFNPVVPGKVERRKLPNGGERFVWAEHYACHGCGGRYLSETLLEEFDEKGEPHVEHV